jgi:hypothetical protein
MYGTLLYVCCKYKELECRLALKTVECELYKGLNERIIGACTSGTKKDDKKKD